MIDGTPLTRLQANAIYDVLVDLAGAREANRAYFITDQTTGHQTEWRFQGDLGFGGKFWRTSGHGAPGEGWTELWRVNCYPEDETPVRADIVKRTNIALDALRRRVSV